MPPESWFVLELAALAVFIMVFVRLSLWMCPTENDKEEDWYRDRESHKRQSNPTQSSIGTLAGQIDAIGDELYAQRQQQNYHEESRALLEKVGVIAAILAAILAGISAVIFYWQLDDARRATIAANRAWVGIYRADHGPLIATKPMYIQLTIVNTGREPALRGNWGIKIRTVEHVPETNVNLIDGLASLRNDACDGIHLFQPGEGTSVWHTLFHTPASGDTNDPSIGPSGIPYVSDSIVQHDIDDALARSKSLVLDTCFVYWSGDQWRRTLARFLLRDRDGAPPSDWRFNAIPNGNSAD